MGGEVVRYLVTLLAFAMLSCASSPQVVKDETSMLVQEELLTIEYGPITDTLTFEADLPTDDWTDVEEIEAVSPKTGIRATVKPRQNQVVVQIPRQEITVTDIDTTVIMNRQELKQGTSFFEDIKSLLEIAIFAAIIIGIISLLIKLKS